MLGAAAPELKPELDGGFGADPLDGGGSDPTGIMTADCAVVVVPC